MEDDKERVLAVAETLLRVGRADASWEVSDNEGQRLTSLTS